MFLNYLQMIDGKIGHLFCRCRFVFPQLSPRKKISPSGLLGDGYFQWAPFHIHCFSVFLRDSVCDSERHNNVSIV